MSQQTPITSFFKSLKSGKPVTMELRPAKRKLSLKRETVSKENVVVLSSDEEGNTNQNCSPQVLNLSQSSVESDSSGKTIIYSLSPLTRKNITPSTSTKATPEIHVAHPSPSSSKKYFSPNKKRSVTKKSPKKASRNLADNFSPVRRRIEFDEDQIFQKACEGQDDKTKFLLKIVNDYLKDASLRPFLEERSVALLSNYMTLSNPAAKLICRLYWHKDGWYKKGKLVNICTEGKSDMDELSVCAMLEALVVTTFLLPGTNENISFKEFTSILKAEELKEICKDLKIKTQSKKGAVESLNDFCRRTSISSYFSQSSTQCNSRRVLQIMSQKVGPCYRLSELARGTLDRLYLLTYLGIDSDVIRKNMLELMLINEKIGRETFPLDKGTKLDNASIVFADRDEFERYYFAHKIYEDFLTRTDAEERCAIVRQVLTFYNDINVEQLIRYRAMPSWLQRFTPPCVYIRILNEGLVDLKKGKDPVKCQLAVDILTLLVEQTFRHHKKAEWFAEMALILHSYLGKPDMAAQVLLKGFSSNLSEEAKDAMRPRAKKLAQQKNISLEEAVRQSLLTHATKEAILECNIPSQHFYKQPMDNITKGKAMYETKNDNGRMMQGVEEYALSCYLLKGEYTGGGHWEGRIITTMFFLLFWDAIYSKPRGVRGVFLSHYQQFPLDMFSEEFYLNRREAIEARLAIIEQCSGAEVAELMMIELDNRPECELSGINRQIPSDDILAVGRALGGRRLAALCRRLAASYRYAHSGFPDLTLWNLDEGKVKFVEVKSDLDKPSIKQIQWMQYLLQNGVDAEFCYVGAHTERPKARRRPKSETLSL